MIYTTKELLKRGETEYSIRCKIKDKHLFLIERGFYSEEPNSTFRNEALVSKKYPQAILTGLSAFNLWNLSDYIPDYFYLATEQHSFPIRKADISQSYQEDTFFKVGLIVKNTDDGFVKTYDLERLLIELFRLKEKYPKEIYYEVLNSFRRIKDKIDFYKLNRYLKYFSNGDSLLMKIKEAL